MSCGVGHRHDSDPTLLWLWHRLAVAALIGPLAWELSYAMGVVQKKQKKKKKKKKKEGEKMNFCFLHMDLLTVRESWMLE